MNKHLPLAAWVYKAAFTAHYEQRLKLETRLEAIEYLKTTLNNLTRTHENITQNTGFHFRPTG